LLVGLDQQPTRHSGTTDQQLVEELTGGVGNGLTASDLDAAGQDRQ